jgi:hypothetical protein
MRPATGVASPFPMRDVCPAGPSLHPSNDWRKETPIASPIPARQSHRPVTLHQINLMQSFHGGEMLFQYGDRLQTP